MIAGLLSLFSPTYPGILVYMLQSVEYQTGPYLRWFWRTDNFRLVSRRRTLERTRAARLLEAAMWAGIALQLVLACTFFILWLHGSLRWGWLIAFCTLFSYPLVWAHLVTVPLLTGRIFIIRPKEKRLIADSHDIFSSHNAIKIAVAGSYGKTSMKEILATVLSQGKKVAVTPANKNVAVSHARFAASLNGDEEVLVIEFGEGGPGDVRRFAKTTNPDIGIITGIAPAHLDHYPTLADAAEDIFSLAGFLHNENVYVNGDSPAAKDYILPSHHVYGSQGIDEWKADNVKVSVQGTEFRLRSKQKTLQLKTGLIGAHHIGPLSAAAVIGLDLGLTPDQVKRGIAATQPFEHRMEARQLHGAWIIDDTYNGNIDGMRVGLELLTKLPAKRKIYVTPGLVDQGVETEAVHLELGRFIAQAKPDVAVLMKNSATPLIQKSMRESGYTGEVRIEDNPLDFYTNIDKFIAAGDLVMMQNDWTDNYA